MFVAPLHVTKKLYSKEVPLKYDINTWLSDSQVNWQKNIDFSLSIEAYAIR